MFFIYLFYYYVFQLEDKTLFHDEFVHYLKYAMIVYKREPAVEHVIEFVARFATSFQSPPKSEEEDEEKEEDEDDDVEDDHPFLSFIFNFLLEVCEQDHHHFKALIQLEPLPLLEAFSFFLPFTVFFTRLCCHLFPLCSLTKPAATQCVFACAS